MSRITDSLSPEDRDGVLEMAAQAIEEDHLLDLCGVMSPKKRDREDANLRASAAREERRRNASIIRGMKGRRESDAIETLRFIAGLSDEHQHTLHLIDAWPLAWKGWVKIQAILTCNSNQLPPETSYRIRLTDRGRAVLSATPSPSAQEAEAPTTQQSTEPTP